MLQRWATGLRAVLRQHRVSFFFSGQATKERLTRFERYAVIRERNNRIKQANREKRELERTEKMNSIPKDSKQLTCEGCSVYLQSSRMDKYGYIDGKVLADSIIHNQQLLNEPTDRTDDTIRIIREVQQQLGVEVLDEKNGPLKNLDNLEVLMRIEQKQQESRKERQAIVPPRQQRKELLCRRCFYLKHHNQLPDEHNHIQPIIDETDEKQLLERIFAKKGDTYYFYLIDIFDVCGTLTETVLERLFLSKMQFTLLLSKFDMVNRKYFNYVAMKPQIRQYIVATLDKLKEQGTVPKDYRLEDYMQYIYFISSDNKVGLNKVKKLLEGMACKVQMIGYPNTGKTSLLNAITSQKKPTSTVPGTSLTFQIGKFNRIKIFDCPGLYNRSSMVNLINKPNAKSLLTWKQPHFAPGILTNSVVFYGGMIQAEGVRVILFGNGGAKAVEKGNSARWLLKNYEEFWKGLPSLEYLNIVKHELRVEFEDGKGPDIEIAGYGFIGLRLCRTGKYGEEHVSKTIALYLPATVEFRVRNTLVLDQGFHDKSAIQKSFRLRRLVEQTK